MGDDVHNIEVIVAAGAAPAEGEELAVGRPGGVDDVALVWNIEFLRIGAVGIHHIELGNAAAVADIGDGLAGAWIPGGGGVGDVGIGKGNALGTIAAVVGDVEFGIALHGGREHDLGAVGGPGGRGVGALVAGEGDEAVGVEGVHADLGAGDAIGGSEAGEGHAGGVGGPARSERDGVEGGERVLIGAVVVHDPKLFCAGARADEGDLRGGDAGEAAGKLVDDLVGELVGEFADLRVGGSAAIDFANDGFAGGAADVVHPGGDGDLGGGFGEIAEGEIVAVERRLGPIEHLQFAGLRGDGGGIEAGGDEFENAGEGEVVANGLREEGGVGFGVVRGSGEIGDGDAGFVYAEAGAGAEPVLGVGGRGQEEAEEG